MATAATGSLRDRRFRKVNNVLTGLQLDKHFPSAYDRGTSNDTEDGVRRYSSQAATINNRVAMIFGGVVASQKINTHARFFLQPELCVVVILPEIAGTIAI